MKEPVFSFFPTNTEVVQLAKGLWAWTNPNNKIRVLVLHYSANPEHDDEWVARKKMGMTHEQWQREMEIDFSVQGEYKSIFASSFSDAHIVHYEYDPHYEVIRSIDFGWIHPACVWLQIVDGQVRVLCENMGNNILLEQWVKTQVIPTSQSLFPNARFFDVCDSAGAQRSDKSEYSSIQILNNNGIFPVYSRLRFSEGIHIINFKLQQKMPSGEPGLVISPNCPLLIDGFRGGYRWNKNGTDAQPSIYNHTMDALRYALCHKFTLDDIIRQSGEEPGVVLNLTPDEIMYRKFLERQKQDDKGVLAW